MKPWPVTASEKVMHVAQIVAACRIEARRLDLDTDPTIRDVSYPAFRELAMHPVRIAGAWMGEVEALGERVTLLMSDQDDVERYDIEEAKTFSAAVALLASLEGKVGS
jgi:hypothetical protein